LADKLGVSDKSVSGWETGRSAPERRTLEKLSKIFDVSLDRLTEPGVQSGRAVATVPEIERIESIVRKVLRQELRTEVLDELRSEVSGELDRKLGELQDYFRRLMIGGVQDDVDFRGLRSLLEQIRDLLAEGNGGRGAATSATALPLELPPAPPDLDPDDKKRWESNRRALESWSSTENARRNFPRGVPAWAARRFCEQAAGMYAGGRPEDISGILWEFIQEGAG